SATARSAPADRQGRHGDAVEIFRPGRHLYAQRQGKRDRAQVRAAVVQCQGCNYIAAARAAGDEGKWHGDNAAVCGKRAKGLRATRTRDATGCKQRGDDIGGTCWADVLEREVDGYGFGGI